MDEASQQPGEKPGAPQVPEPDSRREPGVAWIESLAGEWQSRWQRRQYPQARSGASLLK